MLNLDLTALSYRDQVFPSDCVAVRDIVASTSSFSPSECATAVELVEERLTHGKASEYSFLFAEGPQGVVGYICYGSIACSLWSFDIYWIAIRQELQGIGLGSALLSRAELEIRRAGGRRVYIETSGRADYEKTRAFYDRKGYMVEALLKDFYADGDDKVIFVKALDELI
jgi:D-alanine-D-alanine ligase